MLRGNKNIYIYSGANRTYFVISLLIQSITDLPLVFYYIINRYNYLFIRLINNLNIYICIFMKRGRIGIDQSNLVTFSKLKPDSFPHLAIDPVDLPILILQLATHIDRHVSQITDHRVHLAHILLHLRLTGVVRDLGDITALRAEPVAIVHHPLRLVVHHLTVVVSFPRPFVLLEARASV